MLDNLILCSTNLDEPAGLGWCLDLKGWNPARYTDLQAHSCKKAGRASGSTGIIGRFPSSAFAIPRSRGPHRKLHGPGSNNNNANVSCAFAPHRALGSDQRFKLTDAGELEVSAEQQTFAAKR